MDAQLQNESNTSDREIIISRLIDAPRELVISGYGAYQGGKQTLARLADFLAKP